MIAHPIVVCCFEITETVDTEEFGNFIQLLHSSLPTGVLNVGVANNTFANLDLTEIPHVVEFPAGTSRAEMYNQLISQNPGEDILLLDGPVIPRDVPQLPLASPSSLPLVDDENTAIRWIEFDGVRLQPNPDTDPSAISADHLGDLDFTRDVHEYSPLAILARARDLLHVRGFDERESLASAMMLDLVIRLRRCGGVPIEAFDGSSRHGRRAPRAWDVSSVWPTIASQPLRTSASYRDNQVSQVQKDPSIYRNLVEWSVPLEDRPVLVSVAIATRDRAEYIGDCLNSILAQDFQEFEVIVVDDGSTDGSSEVVKQFSDPRIRLEVLPPSGISAARNRAAALSRGYFTAVHDDDDIMLPHRLVKSLQTLDSEHRASYGSWVNFDNETADMVLHITKSGFSRELVAYSGQTPGHATWLLPTYLVNRLGYDESYSSSVDHNLATRTLLVGLRWKHSKTVLFLRRIHPTQVSFTDSKRQRGAAQLTKLASTISASTEGRKSLADAGRTLPFPQAADRSALFETFGAYLPDHLVRRRTTVTSLVGKKVLALDAHDRLRVVLSDTDLLSGTTTSEIGVLEDFSWDDMAKARTLGLPGLSYTATRRDAPVEHESASVLDSQTQLQNRLRLLLNQVVATDRNACLLVFDGEGLPYSLVSSREKYLVFARKIAVTAEPETRLARVICGFRSPDQAIDFAVSNSLDYNTWQIVGAIDVILPSRLEAPFQDVVA